MAVIDRAVAAPSPALDHLRWIAAFLVVIQHARGFVMVEYHADAGLLAKGFYFLTGFSHSAVMVFFVLSGFLVGGKALRLIVEGSTATQRDRFAVDRIARIGIVLWPAVLLAAAVALLVPRGPVLTAANWAGPNPSVLSLAGPAEWIGTALLLNETVTGTVGFNSPLWSLAFEWSYYVFATGAIFIAARDWRPVALAAVAYMVALAALCLVLRPLILVLFLCWLMGAAAARVRRGVPWWLGAPVFLGVLGYARIVPQTVATDLLVSTAMAILLTDRRLRTAPILPRTGAWLAGFSFSLYAIHIPVMLGLVSAMQTGGMLSVRLKSGMQAAAAVALLVGASYLAAYAFSRVTEVKTGAVRDRLLRGSHRDEDEAEVARA